MKFADRYRNTLDNHEARDITHEEWQQARAVLLSAPLLQAIGQIEADINGAAARLLKLDLEDPKERSEGLRIQGRVQGAVVFLNRLLEIVSTGEKEEDSTDED